MVSGRKISKRWDQIEGTSKIVLEAIEYKLKDYLYDSEESSIQEITGIIELITRLKTKESVTRKAREVGIAAVEKIPELIEDYIGIRILTKNKQQARLLFKHLEERHRTGPWLCETVDIPDFTAMTIASRNSYSIRTGYQAYHVTFMYDSGNKFKHECDVCSWPVELQIMSQLWAFWADFSRNYFYKPQEPPPEYLIPYLIPVSKILDSADDLVSIMLDVKEKAERESEEPDRTEQQSIDMMKEWLAKNSRLQKVFRAPNMPAPMFLLKMANSVSELSVTLEDVESYLQNDDFRKRYLDIVAASPNVHYLPPYQLMLAFIHMGLRKTNEEVVAAVSNELWNMGKALRVPPKPGKKQGTIIRMVSDRKFGLIKCDECGDLHMFFFSALDRYYELEEIETLGDVRVSFNLERIDSKEHGSRFMATSVHILDDSESKQP